MTTSWFSKLFARTALPAPVDLEKPIEAAIRDAEVLVAFSAQSRRSLKADLLIKLTGAIQDIANAQANTTALTPTQQTNFWTAYDELAVAMTPLSAHSIRSSLQVNQRRFPSSLFTPPAALAAIAIIVFGICIVTQSFWVAGKDLLDRADAIEVLRVETERKRLDAETTRQSVESKVKRLDAKRCDLEGSCNAAPKQAEGTDPKKQMSSVEQAELTKLKIQLDTLFGEGDDRSQVIERLRLEVQDLNVRGEPIKELLKAWHRKVRTVCQLSPATRFLCVSEEPVHPPEVKPPTTAPAAASAPDGLNPAASASGLANKPSNPLTIGLARWLEGTRAARQEQEKLAEEARGQRVTAHEVRIILGNLATYVIPLFMGLLGALAYMLQSMTTQLREHTYVPASVSGNIVRICLGAIAGVFGGLATPGADTVLKSLPPLFIPFVFGYGIEILFSLLNRIVRTFTQSDPAQAKGP